MHRFEDDVAKDDFEVEITDLDPDDESRPISATIAALRSRISFKVRGDNAEDAATNDTFEVEITDLLASDEESSSIPIPIVPGALHSRLPRKALVLRLAILGIAIVLMMVVVLGSLPSVGNTVLSLFSRPTPTPTSASETIVSRSFGRSFSGVIISGDSEGILINSTPIAGATVTPWNPNSGVSTVLGRVPQECPFDNVPPDSNSPDFPYGNAVGGSPLWIMGFEGSPSELTGFTRASPPQYGWVRQITLVLESNANGPVMLQGAHLIDETPLLFGDPDSEQSPTTFLTLSLDTSSTSNPDVGHVQWAIESISLYIPSAGCYFLKASWAGGSWEVIFAAGQ